MCGVQSCIEGPIGAFMEQPVQGIPSSVPDVTPMKDFRKFPEMINSLVPMIFRQLPGLIVKLVISTVHLISPVIQQLILLEPQLLKLWIIMKFLQQRISSIILKQKILVKWITFVQHVIRFVVQLLLKFSMRIQLKTSKFCLISEFKFEEHFCPVKELKLRLHNYVASVWNDNLFYKDLVPMAPIWTRYEYSILQFVKKIVFNLCLKLKKRKINFKNAKYY